jgi:hypothetical protein
MPRPKSNSKHVITSLELPVELLYRIRELAEREDVSVSHLFRRGLKIILEAAAKETA